MSKRNIAFITGVGYLPNWCGISESLYQILNNLSNSALTVTTGKNGLYRKLTRDGKKVSHINFDITKLTNLKRLNFLDHLSLLYEFIAYQIRLVFLLFRNKIKVVYISDPYALILSFIPCKIINTKIIVGIRGPCDSLWLISLLLFCHKIVVLSNEMKEVLLARFSQLKKGDRVEKKIEIIYNGIAIPDIKGTHDERLIQRSLSLPFLKSSSSVFLLYVGLFDKRKGQLDFISRVLPLLRSRQPQNINIYTLFVGAPKSYTDEAYFTLCQETSVKEGMGPFVYFAGFQTNIWEWYLASDIVILASQWEGQPRAVLEAMAYARPVVTYDVLSVKEMLVNVDAGIVVPQGDAEGMAKAILSLASDKQKRAILGQNGRKFIMENMDISKIARKYDTLFEEHFT